MMLKVRLTDDGQLIALGSWSGLDSVVGRLYPKYTGGVAQEIVRRVNMHDQLVESCRLALEAICAGNEDWMIADVEAHLRDVLDADGEQSND